MTILVKKTTELSDSEQQGILSLFNAVFKKDRTIEFFRNQFFNTVLGYSYHAVVSDGDKIVGSFSFIPYYYKIKDKRYLAACAVDLMIYREYQCQGYFQKMLSACTDYMRDDDVSFFIVFPNDNAYLGYVKLTHTHNLGNLTVYALPYRIGGIKPMLGILNWLSIFFVNIYVFLTSLFANSKIYHFPIEKDSETFNQVRYSQPDGGYNIEQSKGGGFVYKIMDYEGVRAAFLIDVFVKSVRNFNTAIRHIIKNHRKEFDMLLYVGYLPFNFHGLIKVPQRFSPKKFHFMGQLFHDQTIEADLFYNLNNWDVNLSNYDLL